MGHRFEGRGLLIVKTIEQMRADILADMGTCDPDGAGRRVDALLEAVRLEERENAAQLVELADFRDVVLMAQIRSGIRSATARERMYREVE